MDVMQQKIEKLQEILISVAVGEVFDEELYKNLRLELSKIAELKKLLPDFLQENRSTGQFRQFIKTKFPTYAERRAYIWNEFSVSLQYAESVQIGIVDHNFSKAINKFDQIYIKAEWEKALERKIDDPEGAITSSRTLIETTCKFILDELNEIYEDKIELPQLYKLTAKSLNLAPDQHTEQIFKQILGGCQTVVEGLGALRNKLSDSHGKKNTQVKPSARHAGLAVNLAGTMTTFLLETYEFKIQKDLE